MSEIVAAYNKNPELVEMRHDIAERTFKLTMRSLIITGVVGAIGAALGAVLMPEILVAGAAFAGIEALAGALIGGTVGMMAGGVTSAVVGMREAKKLKIDEEMTGSYMQGKNYWGAGYREEVAEHGYGGPQQTTHRDRLAAQCAQPDLHQR